MKAMGLKEGEKGGRKEVRKGRFDCGSAWEGLGIESKDWEIFCIFFNKPRIPSPSQQHKSHLLSLPRPSQSFFLPLL